MEHHAGKILDVLFLSNTRPLAYTPSLVRISLVPARKTKAGISNRTAITPNGIRKSFSPERLSGKKTFEALKIFEPNSFARKGIWQTDKLHCNIYCFEPGQQNSLYRHPVSDEVVLCLEGEGIIVVGTEHQAIKVGDTVLVPMNIPHGYINTSRDHRMIISVVQCPLPVEHVPFEPSDISTLISS